MNELKFSKERVQLEKEIKDADKAHLRFSLMMIFIMMFVIHRVWCFVFWQQNYALILQDNTNKVDLHSKDWYNFCQDAIVAQQKKFEVDCALAYRWHDIDPVWKSTLEADTYWPYHFAPDRVLWHQMLTGTQVIFYICATWWLFKLKSRVTMLKHSLSTLNAKGLSDYTISLRERTRLTQFFKDESERVETDRRSLDALLD